jgi:hypothetical protein
MKQNWRDIPKNPEIALGRNKTVTDIAAHYDIKAH